MRLYFKYALLVNFLNVQNNDFVSQKKSCNFATVAQNQMPFGISAIINR